MSLDILAGWNTADITGGFSCVIGGAVGSGTATIPTGRYTHATGGFSSVTTLGSFAKFETVVAAALQAAVNNGTWFAAYDATTRLYTIENDSFNFTLTWTGTGGVNLRRALGFSTTATSSLFIATGDIRPYYVLVPQIAGRSKMSDLYEDEEIVTEAVSDDGTPFSISKERSVNPSDVTPIRYCDWQHAMETKAATFARSASASVPWTWEHFFMHCRGEHPFAVVETGVTTRLHSLRAEGASFDSTTRQRVVSDYDGLWLLNLKTRDLGP